MSAPASIGTIDLGDELVARLAARYAVTTATAGGGTIASACAAPIVISAFSDDAALWNATTGREGILAITPQDGVHVTIGMHGGAMIERVDREYERGGRHFVAAPILVAPASEGMAAVLGGAPDTLARVMPAFEAMAVAIAATCQRPADAALLAIAHSAMVAGAMEAIAEALALVRKFEVDPAVLRDVIVDALFARTVSGPLAEAMLADADGNMPSATRGLHILQLAFEAATSSRVPLASVDACRDRLLSAIARGSGDRAWTVVAREQARASGLE